MSRVAVDGGMLGKCVAFGLTDVKDMNGPKPDERLTGFKVGGGVALPALTLLEGHRGNDGFNCRLFEFRHEIASIVRLDQNWWDSVQRNCGAVNDDKWDIGMNSDTISLVASQHNGLWRNSDPNVARCGHFGPRSRCVANETALKRSKQTNVN